MRIIPTEIPEVLILEPRVFADARGFFMETYHQGRYHQAGIPHAFAQDNLSFSVKHTLRGLHFQIRHPQAKLVQALTGEIFDVAVDIRPGSASFGKWVGVILSAENKRQLFIPEGFAHGFCVVSPTAHFSYKCSDVYHPEDEGGILWSDAHINIQWPLTEPLLSPKDAAFPMLRALKAEQLPGR